MLDTASIFLPDPKYKPNPYPMYAQLRAEQPVARFRGRFGMIWLVTRYDDVMAMLKDLRLANDPRGVPERKPSLQLKVLHKLFWPLIFHMLGTDDPDHARLRGLVSKAFTLKRIEALRTQVESLTNELLDLATHQEKFDVVRDYALVIPTTIIAQMLGIPPEDRTRFTRWSDSLLSSSATSVKGMATNLPRFRAFMRYVRELIETRRRHPQDDLVSALIEAEEAGDHLSADELLAMVFLLLIAGYETTVNLIGNGTLALLDNPEQLERLRQHPELMTTAVEEFARYYTPIDYSQPRIARCDFDLSGVRIRQGQPVFAALSSANRDETQFHNADRLDVSREPNRHLGFGHGPHYCLGAFLARMEANVAFTTLLRRCPDLRLAVPRQDVRWRDSFLLRGIESLPVAHGNATQASAA
jgi:cytochrome P450 PksS